MPYDSDDYYLKRTPKPKSNVGKFLINNKKQPLVLLNKTDTSRRFKKAVMKGKREVYGGKL